MTWRANAEKRLSRRTRAVFAAAVTVACVAGAPARGQAVSDADALAITRKHCVMCHAREPAHSAFAEPPKGVVLETVAQLRQFAPSILEQTVVTRAMPMGIDTGMTESERNKLRDWINGLN